MGDIPPPNALYPQPAAAGSGSLLSGDPTKVLGIIGQMNQNALFQQTFNARKAIGQSYQGAIGDDGSIDTQKLMQGIKNNPDAGFMAGEASAGALDRQGKQIENAKSMFGLQAGQNKVLMDGIGALADKSNISDEDLRNFAVTSARNSGVPTSTILSVVGNAPKDQAARHQWARTIQNMAIGSSGVAQRVSGPPTPGGAPQQSTLGSANYGGTQPTGLAPGESELNASPAGRAAALQATATSSPQYHADLENLRTDSKILDNLGGPTFEVEKKLNQLTSRLGNFGITMTPDQLKAGESFDKIVNGISLRQGQMFGNTDAGRSMTLGATPNTSMSKFGREAMIDMAQGNQDAVDAARRAWLKARANGASVKDHDLFMDQIGQEMDPRVFQFNRLSRDNQQKFLSQMDHADIGDFENKYKVAVSRNWVKPLKAPESAK